MPPLLLLLLLLLLVRGSDVGELKSQGQRACQSAACAVAMN